MHDIQPKILVRDSGTSFLGGELGLSAVGLSNVHRLCWLVGWLMWDMWCVV